MIESFRENVNQSNRGFILQYNVDTNRFIHCESLEMIRWNSTLQNGVRVMNLEIGTDVLSSPKIFVDPN
jgi:hypothetical protein